MRKGFGLLAATALTLTLGSAALAQDQSGAEPDCPEDFDTEPGCDMTGEQSERQPVPGAATAPVDEENSDATKTLNAEPEGESSQEGGSSETGASAEEQSQSDGGEVENQSSATVQAQGVKFREMIVYVEPGGTVNWTNMASHNVELIEGMVPEGQEMFQSEIGANISKTFESEGIIVYKCTPHWGNRMGGIIVVGQPENPGETIDAYLQSANENTENLPAIGLLKDLRADMEEKGML